MTVLELTGYIVLALLVQAAIFAARAFYRHWQAYQAMKERLACASDTDHASPRGDMREVAGDGEAASAPGWNDFRALRVARRVYEDEARSVCSFHLVPSDGGPPPPFKPGQFLTFHLKVAAHGPDGVREITRCYSLSDRPGLDHYRISVKRVLAPPGSPTLPPGLSSNHLHDAVFEGAELLARAPSGHFVLRPGDAPIVLLAGGIGLTPLLSMLNAALANEASREVWLFQGTRDGGDHAFKAHLCAMAKAHPNFHLHVAYSRPRATDVKGADYHHEGHVDITLLRLTLPLKRFQFHVCGPPAMMETLVPALLDWGVPEDDIRYEAFGPASLPARPRETAAEDERAPSPITVTFSKSGRTIAWEDEAASLLDFAEKHGIAIASGCRAGACGSCQTPIEAGDVEYARAPDFSPDAGRCLMCVSRPKHDLTLSA